MQVELELNIVDENLTYINFWNYKNGKDVVAIYTNGVIQLIEYGDDDEEIVSNISFPELLMLIKNNIS